MAEDSRVDVLIVGGGAAGMSAALWCFELSFRPWIVEGSSHFGGQLNWIHNPVRNYLGGDFADGQAVRTAFERSMEGVVYECLFSRAVERVDVPEMSVLLDDGSVIEAKAIVIATGVRRRRLGVPGEIDFLGRGIMESGAKQREEVAGKRVAVVGGGDAALENALILSEFAERVFLIHRRESFSARAEFSERIGENPRIEVLRNSVVERFDGRDQLESIRIRSDLGRKEIDVDHALIRVGVDPNSEIVGRSVDLDKGGYIVVDVQCRTSAEGVWAIGDVANPVSPTISTAVGMGATCAKSIEKFIRRIE